MQLKRFFVTAGIVLSTLAFNLTVAPVVWAASEKVIYSFTGGADGSAPHQGLIFDSAGNLYSATLVGGTYNGGTAFELSPNPDGTWTENVLHSFSGGSDGRNPDWGRLTFDSAGNLYGAASYGGSHDLGTLFQLTPNSDGTWTENTLHQFTGGRDGSQPWTTPYFDAQGNLYATASYSGVYQCGTAFEMTPGSGNSWTYRVIHQFANKPACSPWVGMVADSAGNFYGTTRNDVGGCSGPPGCGTVFQLSPGPNHSWTYHVIHQFTGGKGGSDPSVAGLTFDVNGNLFGTTEHSGVYNSGVVYEITPSAGGKWSFQVIHQLNQTTDGACATGQLTFDSPGSLYGTACTGGVNGYGTIYKMTPQSGGSWTFTVLYNFAGSDGANPVGGVIFDGSGNLYGVTGSGGAYNAGAVYEFTP